MGAVHKIETMGDNDMPETEVVLPDNLSDIKSQQYRVDIITTLEGVYQIQEEWQQLYQENQQAFIFASPDWQISWIEEIKPENIFALSVYNAENNLVLFLPMMIEKSKQGLFKRQLNVLRFVGDDPCLYDQMDILAAEGEDKKLLANSVAKVILEYKNEWDMIELNYVSDDSFLEMLQITLNESQIKSTLTYQDCHIVTNLSDSMETYLKDHPRGKKKFNRFSKSLYKQFPEAKIELFNLNNEDEAFEAYFKDLVQKHKSYWSERSVQSVFSKYGNVENFYRSLNSKKMVLSVLVLDGIVLSYDMGMTHRGGYSSQILWYNPDFSKYSPGTVHLGLLLENRIESGNEYFSMGLGDIEYKTRWEDYRVNLYQLTVHNGVKSKLCTMVDNVLLRLRSLIKN